MADIPSIGSVRFQDYKLLRSVDLDLGRLNVIVGRNGIGKSSVLDGLHQLLQLLGPNSAANVFAGRNDPRHLVSRPDATALGVSARFSDGQSFAVRISAIGEQRRGKLDILSGREGTEAILRPDQQPDPLLRSIGVSLTRLDASALAAPHASEREIPQLELDGAGLASVLQYVQGLRDGTLDAIEDDLRVLVPGSGRIRVLPAAVGPASRSNPVTGARFELERGGIGWLAADQLSRGTLFALGLVTTLHWRPARVLLLDDIDQGLHPVALRRLVITLRRVLEQKPALQIIAVSHSPFVLDVLASHEAFIAGAASPTAARITRLDRHPAWAMRSQYLHPGELWTALAEDWVSEAGR